MSPRAGFAYLYWLEAICEQSGDAMPNDAWMPMHFPFFDTVQAAFVAAGATAFSVHDVVMNDPPVAFPPVDDFPMVGYTPLAKVPKLLSAARAADPEREPDPDVREAMEQMVGWLAACASRQKDLICFYH